MSQNFLLHIAVPFKCPLSSCDAFVSSTNLLSHLTQIHHVQVRGVVDGEKASLLINHAYLKSGESVCIGALALKSDKIVHQNALLPCEVEKFHRSLPILIMTSLDIQSAAAGDGRDSLSIWLAAPSMMQTIWGTVTVHDQQLRKSSSQLVRVRRAENSQELTDFKATETNHLESHLDFIEQIKCDKGFCAEIAVMFELK